jgi:hypothetical protein
MQCLVCDTFLDEDTVFCGNCGTQVRPQQARGETLNMPTGEAVYSQRAGIIPTVLGNYRPMRSYTPITPTQEQVLSLPSQPLPPRKPKRHKRLIASLLVLCLVGGVALTLAFIYGSTVSNVLASNASGQVIFLDSSAGFGNTDALMLSLTGLQAPPAGSQYHAWLINTQTEQVNALGILQETGTKFGLNFASPSQNGQPGSNLLSLGDQITVTQEQGQVSLPSGRPLLVATFPPRALVHIKHLLLSFPETPGKIGLLVGLFEQTKLLNGQAQVLRAVSDNQNPAGQECIAQSILDIIEGQKGPDYRELPAFCDFTTAIGDGFGILGANGYASLAGQHAVLATSQSDANGVIRQHASQVEIATTNITNWVTTIQKDALKLLTGRTNKAAVAEIATLAEKANIGFDANGNGQIDPASGEAGATSAYRSGQQMATLSLAAMPSA